MKTNLKEINNIVNNQNFPVDDPQKGETVTPCMDFYKVKLQSDGSLDKLKFRIVVTGDLHNKEIIGDAWFPTASKRTLKYFLEYASKHP